MPFGYGSIVTSTSLHKEFIDNFPEEQKIKDAASGKDREADYELEECPVDSSVADDLESAADDLEAVEFPSMYG